MELFKDLGLKEICNIIATLGINTSISSVQDVIEINDKKYYIEKDGNKLMIVGPDNNKCTISISYSFKEQEENNRKVIYVKHHVDVEQTYKDGSNINMSNNLSLDPGYESFENTYRHDLMRGLNLQYNKEAEFNLGLTRIHLKRNNKVYGFTSMGITEGPKELLIDGDTIKVDSSVDIDNLESMKEALLIRNGIIKDVKESTITPEVLEKVDRHLRALLRQIKNNDKENETQK